MKWNSQVGALGYAMALTLCIGTAARAKNPYSHNGIFLDHGFVVNPMTDGEIGKVVKWMAARHFDTQYLNVTELNADGTLKPSNYSELTHWITVSRAIAPKQKIIVYISGSRTLVRTQSAWRNIADVCRMFTMTYKADGINLDFEPYEVAASNYVGLFSLVRQAIGDKPNLSLDYTSDSGYFWSGQDFNKISSYFDSIMPMIYDSEQHTVPAYKTFVDTALTYTSVNKARACQVVPILPVYEASGVHLPAVENLDNSTDAIWNAVEIRKSARIGGVAVWWYYGWNGSETDAQWTRFWLHRK